MTKANETDFVSIERIAQSVLSVRARRVLLDSELAILYRVSTARLNQQVRRNLERFPGDFMFQLTADERNSLMLQIATSKPGRGGRRKPPLVFTEHGALMAATLLNSPLAVEMSIYIVRAFVQLRDMVASDAELGQRVTKLAGCTPCTRPTSMRVDVDVDEAGCDHLAASVNDLLRLDADLRSDPLDSVAAHRDATSIYRSTAAIDHASILDEEVDGLRLRQRCICNAEQEHDCG